MLVGAPKWLDADHYDIVAKAAIEAPTNGNAKAPQFDDDELREMLRALLIDRFKLVAHMEDRPVSAYTLTGGKAKAYEGRSYNRTRCKEGPGRRSGKDPRNTNPALNRLLTCQNITMGEFAEMLTEPCGRIYICPGKGFHRARGRLGLHFVLQHGWHAAERWARSCSPGSGRSGCRFRSKRRSLSF